MPNPGFNSSQLKQLKQTLKENNQVILKEVTRGVVDVVDNLSQTIKESEERTVSTLRAEIKSEIQKVREDLNNFVTTTPTKYQVERLEKAVFGPTS